VQHARLANANALLEGGQFALDALADGDGSGLSRLEAASQKLQELVEFDPALKESLELITSAHIQVDEAVHALRRYALGVESDDAGLKQMEARLTAIMGAARRYRVAPEALGQRLHDSVTRLEALSALGSGEELEAAARAAEKAYRVDAEALSARRAKAAVTLGKAITETLAGLAMGNGAFVVQLTRVEAGSANGLDEVEFLVSTYAAQAPASLARVASGGELSRISLAIQAALSAVAAVPTLIFDEVDSGIGGRVAEIVGRLLEELGQRHQVMCVTHLPQVASRGQHHFTVTKTETPAGVTSAIARLDGAGRVEEVARMLGGLSITATTRRHAAEMLKSA
jgi:DNA repair protein RecN (Recombination protein N)